MPSAKIAREGIDFPTSFDEATSACVVVEPIFIDLLEILIPERLLIFFIFIRSEYAANLSFIAGIRDMPPAKKVARPVANFLASFVFLADLKLKLLII